MVQNFIIPEKKPRCDRKEVSQFGYVDLRVAYRDGVIDGSLEGSDISSNGIEDPASIYGRVDDVFKAMRLNDSFKAASAVKHNGAKSVSSPTTPSGENPTE